MAGIDFNAKALYNEVQGNKTEFIKRYSAENQNTDTKIAEQMYNFYAGMDTDGVAGLSDEEYRQGVINTKALTEIQHDALLEKYVPKDDLGIFNSLSPVEKQNYIASQIPHAEGDEFAVMKNQIQAARVLAQLDRYKTEIELLKMELESMNEFEEVHNKELVDFLRPYLADDSKIVEFLRLPQNERVEFLKNHLAHTPETTDKQLEQSAQMLSQEILFLEAKAQEDKIEEGENDELVPDYPRYDSSLELSPEEQAEYNKLRKEFEIRKQLEVDSLLRETRKEFFGE